MYGQRKLYIYILTFRAATERGDSQAILYALKSKLAWIYTILIVQKWRYITHCCTSSKLCAF